MALSNRTVWEVRTTGSDNNGGAFVEGSGGTDRSVQDAAFATLTAASVIHTTTTQINVAVGDYTVVAGDVGNQLQVTGGTATVGFYQITAVDIPNNRWTMDRAVGTAGQTVVGAMGGGCASLGKIATPAINGNIIYVKSGTYTMSVNTDNVSNGKWNRAISVIVVGYNTNRTWGNTDTKPIIQASVTLTSMWAGTNTWVYNIEFDANSVASTRTVNAGSFTRCNFKNATLANAGMGLVSQCVATGNSGTPFFTSANGGFFYCEAYANTATGFVCQNANLVGCLSYGNTGATSDGFICPTSGSAHFFNCVAYNNGRDGYRTTTGGVVSRMILQNCVAENNAGYGVNSVAAEYPTLIIKCSIYNNTTGATTGSVYAVATITPTGSVFTNAGAADFSLNNTGSAGALLRVAGYIELTGNTYPRGLTTSYLDVGPAQHQDAGGGGSTEHSSVF